jgi:hypothetical protein
MIIGDFASISNGYSYLFDPGTPPYKSVKVVKGAS